MQVPARFYLYLIIKLSLGCFVTAIVYQVVIQALLSPLLGCNTSINGPQFESGWIRDGLGHPTLTGCLAGRGDGDVCMNLHQNATVMAYLAEVRVWARVRARLRTAMAYVAEVRV